MYNPVRGGNRGGRDQFTWEEIRLLPFKERECYLGSTTKMGYLDKGGRWRMRDWWTKGDKDGPADKNQVSEELRRVQEEDDRRMREALGLEVKKVDNTPHLSQYEINELTKRDRMDIPPPEEGERLAGLGFNPANAKFKAVGMDTVYDNTDYNKLDGEGIKGDDLKRMQKSDRKEAKEQVRKAIRDDIPTAEGVMEASKKIKKEKKRKEKKDRKEKKEKKHKKKEKRDKEKSEREGERERGREKEKEKEKPREDREKEREGRDKEKDRHRDHRDHKDRRDDRDHRDHKDRETRDKHRDRSREKRRSEERDRHRERRRSEDRDKERERRKKSRRDRSRSSSSGSSSSRSD